MYPYLKYLESWFIKKKKVNNKDVSNLYFNKREIWWTSVGINVGTEINGKNDEFERPVLVVKKINRYQFLGVPLTSKKIRNKYFLPIKYRNKNKEYKGYLCAAQIKVFSSKRLIRKFSVLDGQQFIISLNKITKLLFK